MPFHLGLSSPLRPFFPFRLIFFEDYHDDDESEKEDGLKNRKSDSLQNLFHSPRVALPDTSGKETASRSELNPTAEGTQLLNFILETSSETDPRSTPSQEPAVTPFKTPVDLLTNNPEVDDSDKDNMTLLNEILNSDVNVAAVTVFNQQWDDMFHTNSCNMITTQDIDHELHDFLPSQLLEIQKGMGSLSIPIGGQSSFYGKIFQTPFLLNTSPFFHIRSIFSILPECEATGNEPAVQSSDSTPKPPQTSSLTKIPNFKHNPKEPKLTSKKV